MIILLIGAIGLVIWSLQLMKMAHHSSEKSLIFAGVLVAVSAVGLVAVYLLMDGCIGFITGIESVSAQSSSISLMVSSPFASTL